MINIITALNAFSAIRCASSVMDLQKMIVFRVFHLLFITIVENSAIVLVDSIKIQIIYAHNAIQIVKNALIILTIIA